MIKRLVAVILLFMTWTTLVQAQEDVVCPEGYICTRSDADQNINSTTRVESPPPSAISPSVNATGDDTCSSGVAGAVQTQILGISAGKTIRDMNCERLKNAKTLYNMGMKVAAVSVMCQDERVFEAMLNAGTPCPYDGLIGAQAKDAWEMNPEKRPGGHADVNEPDSKLFGDMDEDQKSTVIGGGVVGGLLLLLLL